MKNFFLFFALVFIANLSFSQSSTYGKVTTPKGNFHAVIVYVQLQQYQDSTVSDWSYGSFPNWAMNESLFNVHPDSIGNKENLSKWYNDMSLGEFQFTAEEYPYLITITSTSIVQEDIDAEVFRQIDSIQQYSIFDWSKFDKRTNRPNFLFDNTDTINYPPDGKLDYVIAVYREPGSTGGGEAAPNISAFNDSIGNYVVTEGFQVFRIGGGLSDIYGVFIHEFGHSVYDAPHCGAGNGVTGTRFHTHSMWCMSTTNESRVFNTVNAWERWHLGWSNITYDLKDTTDNGIYTIDDYMTTGDAVRIKIPHTNQYLWIENHQKINSFDRHPWITNTYGDTIEYTEKGIYMYVEDLSPTQTRQFVHLNANKLKLLHANGHFDYSVSANFTPAPEWWNAPAYNFTQLQANPFGEHHQASMLRFDYDNDGKIDYNSNFNNLSSGGPNEMYVMHRLGNNVIYGPAGEGMGFGVGSKVGLGNNPAIANIQYYDTAKQEVNPIHIHNVTVSVESYNPINGTYQIKVLFNDADINSDTRWTGNLKLTQDILNPINNPQRIVVKSGNTITLDQSLTANRETPITLQNGTKSFSLPTILTLESGTITTIEDGSELLVTNGSTLHVKSGATLIVKGTGKITIDNDAFLCMENGAVVELQDVSSTIHLAGTIGINPNLVSSNNSIGGCLELCEIDYVITGNGSITGKTIADAGIDQIICSNPSNNILGGNPSAIQGVAPFTYSWSPTTSLNDPNSPNPYLTTALTTNSSYVLQVTDANGCIGVDTINLTYNPTTTITTSTTNSVCPGTGTATVNVCGNPIAYTYYWNDPQFQTTPTATGLFAGTYSVQVTDADGNVTSVNATVNPTHSTPVYDYVNPVITGNVTWNGLGSTIKVKGEVVVERGGVLTINSSNVEFAYDLINDLNVLYPRARITVQQGGILNVTNSTLTGCSDGKWDGIEVWGKADTSARTTGLTGVQGFVKLNGATIKNALRGVLCNRTIRLNERSAIFQGARLDVDNCQFINNRNSIIFGNYAYNSLNYVKNSTFNYNYNSLFTEQDKAGNEVVFIQVGNNKISLISNNVFRDVNSQENVIGVRSENANYLPILTNTFYNVFTGVDASGINSLNGLAVTQNTFNQCKKGVFAKGITGLSLNQNTFNIPSSPTDTTYGIYLLDCNMYSIQENIFNSTAGNNTAAGLYIYNTDVTNNTQTNQVYRNTFNNLKYASFGNGVNGNGGDPTKGLTFKCNTYVGNDYDILTTIAPGISTQQGSSGSSTTPAGNKFADACGAITDGELYNAAAVGVQPNSYQYWYHNTPTYIPDAGCYTPSQVQPNNAFLNFEASGTGESCPTNFGSCGGACRDSIRLVQITNTNIINQLTTTLDGGNTTTLTTAITAGTQSAGQLKNGLMQNSPLSSAVLIALINSNYSAGILKEVLLQNSPLSNQVLYALLTRQPQLSSGIVKDILQQSAPLAPEIFNLALANNYTGGITNQIINNQQNTPLAPSVTQITEANISELTRENNLLTNRLVRSFLHDIEDEYRFDSISVLLKTGGGIIPPGVCKTCAIEADVIGKNYTAALQEINALEQQGIEPEFTLLQRTLIDMETMPDKLMSVVTDSTLKTTVEAIAVQTNKKGSINARNLLYMAFHKKIKESYHFPQHNSNNARLINNIEPVTDNQQLISQQQATAYQLTNYPNPFDESTTIQAVLPENKVNTYLVIHDLMGREIYRILLKSGVNKQVIDKNVLQPGIYLYAIEENGVVVNKQKLVKLK